MNHNPQVLVFKDKIYVGGGYSNHRDGRATILEFDPHIEVWRKLPKCEVKFFGIVSIGDQLLTIGGTDVGTMDKATDQISSLNPMDKDALEWHPFRCTLPGGSIIGLKLPRQASGPCVSMYKNWIIMLGGVGKDIHSLTTTDILNTDNFQWSSSKSPFPVRSSTLCSSVVQNTLFVFVHTLNNPGPTSISKMVYRAKLHNLTRPNLVWERIPDTPLAASIPIRFNNHLLAIGGKYHFDIYLFTTDEIEKWKKLAENMHVNDKPVPSYQCTCVQIPSNQDSSKNEFLVIGGLLDDKPLNTVYKVKIPQL